ncbi:Sau3AI family type II restriction endonuclease [Candidatus Enterococcus lemimoniae]|uniref:DNA mismatch repair MutH/Type II restriction enzyme Sau3AI domain-containing protein n=1 Tax=Candidatus Enterococcus lemimoniae TaxID=1834167 RepID=A0ABZ2TA05_9ENTE|nr:Sau3AI family type II restriction endonuclease [Enterococcus sp. 12C11_DIV0727]OTO69909.1 hypothetical protein A5866_002127 [Enterococcus sp. 12C11_DIV0727]
MKYMTKQEVHNRAVDAIGECIGELDLNNRLKQNGKGDIGIAIEEGWFDHPADNLAQPDFPEAGVELKVTPYKKLKNGDYSAKERLVLNMIDYSTEGEKQFEESSFWFKNKVIELMHYQYIVGVPKTEMTISSAHMMSLVELPEIKKNRDTLIEIPSEDFDIIKNDWEKINSFISLGKADELSESLTNYLGACKKGSKATKLKKYKFSEVGAFPRAYSFKQSYMTSILREHIMNEKKVKLYESIIKEKDILKNISFEEYVISKIDKYAGKTQKQLFDYFNIEVQMNNKGKYPKNANNMIIRAILGLTDTNGNEILAEEFDKANIRVKTIVLKNKIPEENMKVVPIPSFIELSKESWDSSKLREYFETTRFLFIVFNTDGDDIVLKGAKFWNMELADLDNTVRFGWENTIHGLKEGVVLEYNPTKNAKGYIIKNNLLKQSDDVIIHLRPDSKISSYIEGDLTNARELPSDSFWINRPSEKKDELSDKWMQKQAFWLNKQYIAKQVKELS